jgi:hypothetical protein
MGEFKFRDEVRRLMDAGLVGPDEITEKLLTDLTTAQLIEIARPWVHNGVRMVIKALRINPVRPAAQSVMHEVPGNVVPFAGSKRTQQAEAPKRAPAGQGNSARSWRQFNLSERLDRALSGQFSYGGVSWGITGDLAIEQVRDIASKYNLDARTLIERGLNWDALAAQMTTHKARRVRDLPEQVLTAFFFGEAAA